MGAFPRNRTGYLLTNIMINNVLEGMGSIPATVILKNMLTKYNKLIIILNNKVHMHLLGINYD